MNPPASTSVHPTTPPLSFLAEVFQRSSMLLVVAWICNALIGSLSSCSRQCKKWIKKHVTGGTIMKVCECFWCVRVCISRDINLVDLFLHGFSFKGVLGSVWSASNKDTKYDSVIWIWEAQSIIAIEKMLTFGLWNLKLLLFFVLFMNVFMQLKHCQNALSLIRVLICPGPCEKHRRTCKLSPSESKQVSDV